MELDCIAVLAAKEILSLFHSHSLLADGVYYNFLIMMMIIYVEIERTQEVTWSQFSSIPGKGESLCVRAPPCFFCNTQFSLSFFVLMSDLCFCIFL